MSCTDVSSYLIQVITTVLSHAAFFHSRKSPSVPVSKKKRERRTERKKISRHNKDRANCTTWHDRMKTVMLSESVETRHCYVAPPDLVITQPRNKRGATQKQRHDFTLCWQVMFTLVSPAAVNLVLLFTSSPLLLSRHSPPYRSLLRLIMVQACCCFVFVLFFCWLIAASHLIWMLPPSYRSTHKPLCCFRISVWVCPIPALYRFSLWPIKTKSWSRGKETFYNTHPMSAFFF